MSYIPTIDESSCIAQGDCADSLPDVFVVDDRARVVGVSAADDALLEAARNCPTQAIVLLDSESGREVYP